MKRVSTLSIFVMMHLLPFAQNNLPTIKEYKKVLTTYPFSDPDPIPKPDLKTYPYFRFDGFTDTPTQKGWKVVELENDYIKLLILPEVGGKVWSAIEKSTGRDFIYHNQVVKFRDIAMRGPWTSGGVEANYGIIGHTPNCATPVDYVTVQRADGSVSCVIGVLDLLTRTSWKLDINLPKDKAYFTTSSFWFNSTPYDQPYYTWMNIGLKAAGDLQFIYPGKNYLGHEGEYGDWPINKRNGKDLTFYNNNNFGGYKSFHVFGKYTDFFGAYWHDDAFGMGRYSNRDDKPGKKIWIWGLSQQGMIWEKLLTDTDGQYVEVQSGRLFNQSSEGSMFTPFKHRSFMPHQADFWTEYWFPVKQTRGFVMANKYGAVNVKREKGWLKIFFSPLQLLNEKLEITVDCKQVYSKDIHVQPLVMFSDSIKSELDDSKLKLTIGGDKLVWNASPEEGDLSRPMDAPKTFDNNSIYGLYLQGKNYISFKDYIKAEEKLTACLQIDSNYSPALNEMAFLQLRRFKYEQAVATAKKSLSINTYDPAANFYYGLANLVLGNITDAKDGFDLAASSVEYRSASYTQLAKIYFLGYQQSRAIEYAEKALVFNQHNLEALQLLAVIYRKKNDAVGAKEILDKIAAVDPLNHFVRFENFCWNDSPQSEEKFTVQIKNELPQQTYLELGIWYQQLNCNMEALRVFSLAPPSAEIVYWSAFLEKRPVDLSAIQTGINFPFRSETVAVLEELLAKNDHWLLKYHLGLIEWNRNNLVKAKLLFGRCGSEPADPAFYAARASLQKDDPQLVAADLRRAIQLDKSGWRYPKLLVEHLLLQKQNEQALEIAASFYKGHRENYVMGMLYAKTLLLNKRYAAADSLLGKLKILPFEGAVVGRQLFHEAKLMQAVIELTNQQYKKALQFVAGAREWPENLGVGKPYEEEIDQRLEDWLDYQCYSKMGNKASASLSLKKILAFTPKVENTILNFLPANHLVTALAMEMTESGEKGGNWLKAQASLYPDNKIIQWCLSVYLKRPLIWLKEEEKDGEVRVMEQLLKF